jgi:hypothetical protein
MEGEGPVALSEDRCIDMGKGACLGDFVGVMYL